MGNFTYTQEELFEEFYLVALLIEIRYINRVMVNRMRHTRAHTANRRSHHALKARTFALCSECGAPKMNHALCLNCGKYKGKVIVDVNAALVKKEKKVKARNAALGAPAKKAEATK